MSHNPGSHHGSDKGNPIKQSTSASDNVNRYTNSVDKNNQFVRSKPLVPREKFFKLSFPDDISLREKLDWSNRYSSRYQNEITIPNKTQWWFKHIYVLRTYQNIISDLLGGKIGNINFISADIPPKPKRGKFKEYICKGFPPSLDERDLVNQLGAENVHLFKRIRFNNISSSSVKVVWKSENPPPSNLPLMNSKDVKVIVQEMVRSNPLCYNCQQHGHISSNCNNAAICPSCGENHSLRDCPLKGKNTNEMNNVSSIKCYRCKKTGVNAWTCTCDCIQLEKSMQMQEQASSSTKHRMINSGSETYREKERKSVQVSNENSEEKEKLAQEIMAVKTSCKENQAEILHLNTSLKSLKEEIGSLKAEIEKLNQVMKECHHNFSSVLAATLENVKAKTSQTLHEIGNNVASEFGQVREQIHDNSCNTKTIISHLEKLHSKIENAGIHTATTGDDIAERYACNGSGATDTTNYDAAAPSPATKMTGQRTQRGTTTRTIKVMTGTPCKNKGNKVQNERVRR